MDPTVDAMLVVYAAALGRHRQHLEDGCDRHAWHVLARHLIERAVWSANSTEEAVRDGRPLPFNPDVFNQNDHQPSQDRHEWPRSPPPDPRAPSSESTRDRRQSPMAIWPCQGRSHMIRA
jgi:hypothetical protein